MPRAERNIHRGGRDSESEFLTLCFPRQDLLNLLAHELRLPGRPSLLGRQRLNLADKAGQIRGHHFPDLFQVHAFIEVDKLVAGSGNRLPGHFGMRCPELRRYPLHGLANDQELMQNR
jgi:hypothetical protein